MNPGFTSACYYLANSSGLWWFCFGVCLASSDNGMTSCHVFLLAKVPRAPHRVSHSLRSQESQRCPGT